jgi:predicted GNAT family N-acyltransferase
MLVLAISCPETRKRFQDALARIDSRMHPQMSARVREVVELDNEQRGLIESLKTYFGRDNGKMAVLISDWLVRPGGDREANTLARECQAEFGQNAFGTIAIMPRPRRVEDIDRTINSNCTDCDLENTLRLVTDRLDYISPPACPRALNAHSITVRSLRTNNETELREYFSLRHSVYSIMGYLEEEVEDSRSKLEVNEADVHAIHLVALHRDGKQERLVGTARVVTNTEPDGSFQRTLEAIVRNDPVARQHLDTPYSLGLPIFQSHKGMNRIIQEVFARDKTCGELSRVIVAPEFRGCGISRMLIGEALRKSIGKGVDRLFLECLQVHEALYQEHGFKRISGVVGPVVDVGRTMIAMEMRAESIERIRTELPMPLPGRM